MSKRDLIVVISAVTLLFSTSASAIGESPLTSLIPFRRVEADTKKTYELTEQDGPWLILAASFSGNGADKQAHALVIELRSRFKLQAYIHRQTFDYTQPVKGLMPTSRGEAGKANYANAEKYDGLAVLVGNYRSVEDPELEKALERIKYAKPDCLDISSGQTSTQRFAALRELQRKMNLNPEKHTKGPMGSAFATRNPMLPEDYFARNGVDEFVARLNKDVEHSLLDNPGKYTVRVATFRGAFIDQSKIETISASDKVSNKLEVAADKAHRLTQALRKKRIEAYEFHDRSESVVTVGSFDSVTEGGDDENAASIAQGTIKINPEVFKIINIYKAQERSVPGHRVMGLQPRVLDGITFDVQPLPIEVPHRSISADYSRN